MKYLIILLFGLYSCGAQFHLNKASKHQAKAIDKGAILSTPNEGMAENDTTIVTNTFMFNDTVYVESIKTIEKVVYKNGEIRYVTRKDKRKEVKKVKIDTRRQFKLDKIKERTSRVVARKNNKTAIYWLIFVVIVVIVIITIVYIKKKL